MPGASPRSSYLGAGREDILEGFQQGSCEIIRGEEVLGGATLSDRAAVTLRGRADSLADQHANAAVRLREIDGHGAAVPVHRETASMGSA